MDNQHSHNPATGAKALVAKRYAHALYDLAGEQKQSAAVESNMRDLQTLCQESAPLKTIITDPRAGRDKLISAMQSVSKTAKFHGITEKFLGLIASKGRLQALPLMIQAFLDIASQARGEQTATVTSYAPLDKKDSSAIQSALEKVTGGTIRLNLREDKGLLGGLVIKLGSHIIDASIQTQLSSLSRALKNTSTPMSKETL